MDERQKREQEGSLQHLQMSWLRSSRHSSEGAVDFTIDVTGCSLT